MDMLIAVITLESTGFVFRYILRSLVCKPKVYLYLNVRPIAGIMCLLASSVLLNVYM